MKKLFNALLLIIIIISGCNSNGIKYSAVNEILGDSAKITKTANLSFKVSDVRNTIDSLIISSEKLGGKTIHHQLEARIQNQKDIDISSDSVLHIAAYNITGKMVLKIPEDSLQEFITGLNYKSNILNSRVIDFKDMSLQYLSNTLYANAEESTIRNVKPKKSNDVIETIAMKENAINKQLNNFQIDQDVAFSTVSIDLTQNNILLKEIMVKDDLENFKVPPGRQFINALIYGWQGLLSLIIGVLFYWPFLLLLLLFYVVYKKAILARNTNN